MRASENRFSVFGLESGDFVWFAGFSTREEAEASLPDYIGEHCEYAFIIECSAFFTAFEPATDNTAVHPDNIAVGLRNANRDLPRTPVNIAGAIASLTAELEDLIGEEDVAAAIQERRAIVTRSPVD